MKIFLDTAEVDDIKRGLDWGVVDGVTTNPTHIANSGRPFKEVVKEICELVDGPVSVEVTSLEAQGMLEEAREVNQLGDNVVVKVPLIKEGIKAIGLMSKEGIRTNATLNFNAAQALLAAKAGADYVSPFVGRLDNVGQVGMDLVAQIKTIYDNYGFATEIIVAALRHPTHVLESALAGADICTMRMGIFEMLMDHPQTDKGLEQFLQDWEKVRVE